MTGRAERLRPSAEWKGGRRYLWIIILALVPLATFGLLYPISHLPGLNGGK